MLGREPLSSLGKDSISCLILRDPYALVDIAKDIFNYNLVLILIENISITL